MFNRKRLKMARLQKKLTQEELAKKVNTTKGTISNYENGHSTPDDEMLVKLADALDCSTDWLLGRVEEPDEYATKEAFLEVLQKKGLDFSDLTDEEIESFFNLMHDLMQQYIKSKNQEK